MRFVWPSAILVFVLVLFSPMFFSGVEFIGNSDRLNFYLSMRMFEIDMVRSLGRVPLWNDRMFMGFNFTALSSMIVIINPISWIIAATNSVYPIYLFDLFAIAQYALMGLVMYFLLQDIVKDRVIASVGAIIYLTSYQIYFRTFQIEDAALNYIMLPAAILLIRKIVRQPSATRYFGLFLTCFVMMASFLQETSYALLAIAAYVGYLYFQKAPFRTLAGISIIVLCAMVAASPRIIGVFQDIGTYVRDSQLHSNPYWEVLRLVYEGLFGRDYQEADRTTDVNVHEGYAVYASVFVLPILLALGPLVANKRENIPIAGFAALIGAALFSDWAMPFVFALWLLCTWQLTCRDRGAISSKMGAGSNDDLVFFAGLALALSILILSPYLMHLLYILYFKMDFSHSRLSFVVAFALAIAVSVILARFARQDLSDGAAPYDGNNLETFAVRRWWLLAGLLVLALLCERLLTWLPASLLRELPILVPMIRYQVILQQLLYASGMLAIFIAGTIAFFRYQNLAGVRQFYVLGVCAFLVVTGGSFAFLQILGTPTRTFPVPFEGHKMLTVPNDVFRLPSSETIAAVHRALEADDYRSAFLLDPAKYLSFVESYVSQFWQLRAIDGYGAGVPKLLADIPLPDSVVGKRTIRFSTPDELAWPPLAFVNVKYAVPVGFDFFYNVRSIEDHREFAPKSLKPIENPFHVVPRAFFAQQIRDAVSANEGTVQALSFYEGDAQAGSIAEDGRPFPQSTLVTRSGTILPVDPRRVSIVDGITQPKTFAPGSGLKVEFKQDTIVARMDSADNDRFLVLNELYHPDWRAVAHGRALQIFRTNHLMRGVIVPKEATEVVFTFVPFLATKAAYAIFLCGFAMAISAAWYFGRQRVPSNGPSSAGA